MSVTDANLVQLAFITEGAAYGTTIAGSNLKKLRHTGEGLKQDTSVDQSKEIRTDRQVADIVRTSIGASGSMNLELSYDAYDEFLLAALMAASWSSPVTIGPITTVSAAATDNSFNDSGSGFATLVVNQWVKVAGFTTLGNNGYCKILTKTSSKITVSGLTLVDEAAGDTVTIKMGAMATNGVTKTSFNVERKYTELTNTLALFRGCMLNEFNLTGELKAMVTGNFGILGANEISLAASAGTGYTEAATNGVMNCVDNVLQVLEGGASGSAVLGFSLALNNNLRQREKIGTLGAFSIGTGKCNISGTLRIYFESSTIFDKYLNFTATGFASVFQDVAGNGYVFEVPRIKLTAAERPAAGENQDIIVPFSWQGAIHPTELITVRVTKFAA